MYTSLIFAFLVIALTLYLVIDNKRVMRLSDPYLAKLGKFRNMLLILVAFGYLALLGASVYIVYKYVQDPTVPISYDDVYNNVLIDVQADSDYIGNEIGKLEGTNFVEANYNVGAQPHIEKHLMSGRDYEPKLVSPNAYDSCGPLVSDRYIVKRGGVLITPVSDFPASWVQ